MGTARASGLPLAKPMPTPRPTTNEPNRGVYPAAEAARIAHLGPRRVSRWLGGYTYALRDGSARDSKPVFPRLHGGESIALTFADLIELLYVKHFVDQGVTMPWVKRLHEEARAEFGVAHPFAAKRFETDGKSIFHRFIHEGRERLEDRKRMQIVERTVFNPLMRRIDHDVVTEAASLYWPMGKNRLIVLDPMRSFGEPIVARSHVPTRVLFAAVRKGGEPRTRVAKWYGVTPAEVDAAIAYEESLNQRAA